MIFGSPKVLSLRFFQFQAAFRRWRCKPVWLQPSLEVQKLLLKTCKGFQNWSHAERQGKWGQASKCFRVRVVRSLERSAELNYRRPIGSKQCFKIASKSWLFQWDMCRCLNQIIDPPKGLESDVATQCGCWHFCSRLQQKIWFCLSFIRFSKEKWERNATRSGNEWWETCACSTSD